MESAKVQRLTSMPKKKKGTLVELIYTVIKDKNMFF